MGGPGVLGNDTIPCGSAAKLRVLTPPLYGQVMLYSNGGLQYTPTSSTGRKADQFQYEVECPGGLTTTATVYLPGE